MDEESPIHQQHLYYVCAKIHPSSIEKSQIGPPWLCLICDVNTQSESQFTEILSLIDEQLPLMKYQLGITRVSISQYKKTIFANSHTYHHHSSNPKKPNTRQKELLRWWTLSTSNSKIMSSSYQGWKRMVYIHIKVQSIPIPKEREMSLGITKFYQLNVQWESLCSKR